MQRTWQVLPAKLIGWSSLSTCLACYSQAELSAERRTRQTRVVEITVTSKICRQCAEKKHVSAFNRNKNNPDGLASYCKPCRSQNEAGARVRLLNASIHSVVYTILLQGIFGKASSLEVFIIVQMR